MPEPTCNQLRSLAPELALGALDGRERAEALAHVSGCQACREELRRHTEVADELIATVPSVEPPAGFETRTLERIARSRPPAAVRGPRRRRAMLAAAAAAAAAAVVAIAAGSVGYDAGTHRTHQGVLRHGTLVSDGRPVGVAYLYGGTAPFVYMGVSVGAGDDRVTCELEAGHRVVATVGTFSLTDGSGWWGAPAPAVQSGITGARLVDAAGTVVAETTFGS
ncbi:zf-HC2 domain-containing protein [Acidiferrimicrobium sp. IK]|uniref:zf-HC2 domain-containing protein n=1 Tax=Acidiferrimicrobium sp. IK TaxID=2871700 RepID=UPI0021CB0FAA|nr:zf-HC2 domain-containing protein [Acidiferrimicrobium sp. IK]MCU4187322.1 zf-HC2 domain-containing protein [Acidiferrimicrobium sp. IK]